jgi:hypothetical protein
MNKEQRPDRPSHALGSTEEAGPPDASGLSFVGIAFERILTEGKDRPFFMDFDTGRYMTPPFDLVSTDNRQITSPTNLLFTPELKRWVRIQGIDAVAQTDERVITLADLEMKVGELWTPRDRRVAQTPAEVWKSVGGATRPDQRGSATSTHIFVRNRFESLLPVITREGGVGALQVHFAAHPHSPAPKPSV